MCPLNMSVRFDLWMHPIRMNQNVTFCALHIRWSRTEQHHWCSLHASWTRTLSRDERTCWWLDITLFIIKWLPFSIVRKKLNFLQMHNSHLCGYMDLFFNCAIYCMFLLILILILVQCYRMCYIACTGLWFNSAVSTLNQIPEGE